MQNRESLNMDILNQIIKQNTVDLALFNAKHLAEIQPRMGYTVSNGVTKNTFQLE